ncbi:MAG: hypothetical protein MJ188_03455 [Treponema sp.]|nr:hypothetical protein [Treponema sp.]
MEIQTENGLKEALKFLEEGNPVQAQQVINGLFEHDLESKELSYTNRCCIFWLDTSKRLLEQNHREQKTYDDYNYQGDILLSEWKSFQLFLSKEKFTYEPALYAVRKGFFSTALKHFTKLISVQTKITDERDTYRKAEIFKNAGICYKKLGDFESARDCLSEANNICPNRASVLAELADCYSLCGEDRYGKVLFREAFFIDPESIDVDFLDSELIKYLINKTKEMGYKGKVMQYWIPVYGVLCSIFNIKRDLTSQEVCRLKQNIFAMENENKDPSSNSNILIPKLLNSYFWLIDHYVQKKENLTKINEILLKIKILDSSVYETYIR